MATDYRTSLRIPVRHKLLSKLREERELKQQQVEEACGLKVNVLTQYECGRINMPLPTLEKLAAFYKVPVASLLTEESKNELIRVAKRLSAIVGAKFQLNSKTT